MLYLPGMKKYFRTILILVLAFLLALLMAAFTQALAAQSSPPGKDSAAAFLFQTTATPQLEDKSEIGSTDGIVVMGGMIALIVVLPILVRRKYWMRQPSQ
jgi:hypothetical protein